MSRVVFVPSVFVVEVAGTVFQLLFYGFKVCGIFISFHSSTNPVIEKLELRLRDSNVMTD